MPIKRLLWLLGFLAIATVACVESKSEDTSAGTAPSAKTSAITVAAAASLQNSLQEIKSVYEQQSDVDVIYSFGSSGSLTQQILQGAPVDVFLSASNEWMDKLSEKGEIVEDSYKPLLTNALVLTTPKRSSQNKDIGSLLDLKKYADIAIAVGAPDSVPVGRYTQQALSALNLYASLQPKLVYGKSARQVLAYVETGNVDAGIVYATDALASERVSAVETVNSALHAPIVYPVAVIQTSQEREAAQAFVNFLSTPRAKEIFERSGFGSAPAEQAN